MTRFCRYTEVMDQRSELEKQPRVKASSQNEGQLKINRRGLLKTLGVLAAALAANRVSNAVKNSLESKDLGRSTQRASLAAQADEDIEQENSILPKDVFQEVFGSANQAEKQEAKATVKEMKNEVLYPHSSFEGMLAVTNTYQTQIRQAAEKFEIPVDLASGIIFIENGGAPDLTSGAGARGPAQLLPDTARQYGLRVDETVDERTDPDKCFNAMCNYLYDLRERFGGELGIAVWGYHAGDGNVYAALRAYFLDTERMDLGDIITDSYEDAQRIANGYTEKIKHSGLNVHQLLSNKAVKRNVLAYLEDETELYIYKAVAGAEIFAESHAKGLTSRP